MQGRTSGRRRLGGDGTPTSSGAASRSRLWCGRRRRVGAVVGGDSTPVSCCREENKIVCHVCVCAVDPAPLKNVKSGNSMAHCHGCATELDTLLRICGDAPHNSLTFFPRLRCTTLMDGSYHISVAHAGECATESTLSVAHPTRCATKMSPDIWGGGTHRFTVAHVYAYAPQYFVAHCTRCATEMFLWRMYIWVRHKMSFYRKALPY